MNGRYAHTHTHCPSSNSIQITHTIHHRAVRTNEKRYTASMKRTKQKNVVIVLICRCNDRVCMCVCVLYTHIFWIISFANSIRNVYVWSDPADNSMQLLQATNSPLNEIVASTNYANRIDRMLALHWTGWMGLHEFRPVVSKSYCNI